ncbi:hypothetical protein AURDEDRAFT_129386 [Auricularia subglabra TFB-10046 SS5]|nr:hypothetical protein AURDEDRAFT_129386 [Auricularia subglabra TFB-10046 SS5]
MPVSDTVPGDSVHDHVRSVYDPMRALDLSVIDFMYALLGGDEECCTDDQLRGARTAITKDSRLAKLLRTLHRPPRTGRTGKKPQAARVAIEDFALKFVISTFKRELEAYEKTTSLDPDTLELSVLQSITLSDIFSDLRKHTSDLYPCMKELMETYQQRRRNTKKTPDTMAAIVISIMRHGKLQNYLSMFFKAEGVPVRC